VGLILDSSLLIADERNRFNLSSWLRARPSEPVAVSAITLSELWFGIESEPDPTRRRRRRRWLEKTSRRLEVVPLDAALARIHARVWVQLSAAGLVIGPHDLIIAATAIHRRWALATFNEAEFRHVRGLEVIKPQVLSPHVS
jgi:predicted nucleic acid-binding protein